MAKEGFSKTKDVPAGKSTDMKFICKYIEMKAAEAGFDTSDRNLSNVRTMFLAAGLETIATNRRGDQLVWSTIIKKLRAKLKLEQARTT